MEWININDELPQIDNDCWRTHKPLVVKLADGSTTITYYEKVKDSADGERWISSGYLPKFICADRYADNFKEILPNVVEWMELPE